MTQNNFRVAITGGICSGKSTVSKIIAEQGYSVFSCDEIYRELLNDKKFVALIDCAFNGVMEDDGSLDKVRLSQMVFGNEANIKKLNRLTHPFIMQRVKELMADKKVSFCEVPLLFEGGFENMFDAVIVVLRSKEARVKELMQRAVISENQAILRLNSQFNYDNSNFSEYYAIHNNSNLANLRNNTLAVLEKILKQTH